MTRYPKSSTEAARLGLVEINRLLKELTAESKANPKVPFCKWNEWPAQNERYRHWKAGENRRARNRMILRRAKAMLMKTSEEGK